MKKLVFALLLISVVFLATFVIADNQDREREGGQAGSVDGAVLVNSEDSPDNDGEGGEIPIGELKKEQKIIRIRNYTAKTYLNITSDIGENNKARLRVRLVNGSEIEVKIMPDTAAERALERLRLKVCSEANNCTIELKDTGERDQEQQRLRYEIQIERHSRILGIFQKKMQVRAEVSAETGEVVRIRKPWWAFIASEPAESEEA